MRLDESDSSDQEESYSSSDDGGTTFRPNVWRVQCCICAGFHTEDLCPEKHYYQPNKMSSIRERFANAMNRDEPYSISDRPERDDRRERYRDRFRGSKYQDDDRRRGNRGDRDNRRSRDRSPEQRRYDYHRNRDSRSNYRND